MDLKGLLRQTPKARRKRGARRSDDRRGYLITANGARLRALMLLPVALFGLFLAVLSVLPFLVRATWRLAEVAGRAEQVRRSGQSKRVHPRDEDVIDI